MLWNIVSIERYILHTQNTRSKVRAGVLKGLTPIDRGITITTRRRGDKTT